MFQDEYKDLMNEVKPDEVLVEAMVERQKQRKVVLLPKAVKVAVAVLCGLIVLTGGTVAVDAATDGAVRKLFGFRDSVVAGADEVKLILREEKRGESSIMVGMREGEDGKITTIVKSSQDVPVFTCYIGIEGREPSEDDFYHYQVGCPLYHCESKDDYAWAVYYILMTMISGNREITEYDFMREGWINELERIKTEIGTGDDLRDGCAMGVQLAIDELKANTGRNIEILQLNVFDYEDADGDGECCDLRGYSYVRVDKEAWKKESEENGRMEFEVEAMGGIPGKYIITVKGYEFSNLYFDAEPVK